MMNITSPFDYGIGRRSEEGGKRHYLTEQNKKVPSVTTILSHSKDMTHLLEWQKRIGKDAADTITRESAALGTMMHTHLENYIQGKERPGGTNIGRVLAKNMADVIINKSLCHVDEVWGIEVPLIYDSLWAGTTDLVGIYKGLPTIMDFKTTRKPKKVEHIQDYQLQLTAYKLAHNLKFGTDIKRGVIFMVSRDLQYQEFMWEGKDFEDAEHDWVSRVEKYYESIEESQ